MKRTLYMLSGTLRGIFFILLTLCVVGIVLYAQDIVRELREESRDIVEFYAKTVERIATSDIDAKALGWAFTNINEKIDFPIIMTDPNGVPTGWRGLDIDPEDRSPHAMNEVNKIMARMKRQTPPVPVYYKDPITSEENILQYLYYGESKNIVQLALLPYISLSLMGLLALIAFVGFNSIKASEQRFIWVGMAKETAHQLGTPVSSLLGWVEMLKTGDAQNTDILTIAQDMRTDVARLEKVAARFSQIGSQSDLKVQDIVPIFRDISDYFNRRLPQAGKEIKIVQNYSAVPPVAVNRDLFEWALENLIKNSIDAVKSKKGIIEISTGLTDDNRVYIDIRDNGIGITAKRKHDIFKPGYSTKKRGWGLGLSLAKRIIEEYHHGRLYVKESRPGEGTTMRIELCS
ncbi:HAMP domain-containing histidine kinase [candidate division KSB1 bacterium]|nr:HAMP domain-containing histidine kinase [candidate division KSB1 bacterium]